MATRQYIKTLLRINFNTLYLNFKCFKFKQAIKLPILVSRRCNITALSGQVIINSALSPGMITIGYGNVGLFNGTKTRTILKIEGVVEFNGKANIGYGSKIDVDLTGHLKFGHDLYISASTSIICHKNIAIGNNCVLSWDILLMDTDLHTIKDFDGKIINAPKPITIGDNVWIGCRCLILKGTAVPANNVIAAASTLTKTYDTQNSIIGSNKVLKENISWEI